MSNVNESTVDAARLSEAFGSLRVDSLMAGREDILTGGGGGFTLRFTDFVVENTGEALVNFYIIDLTGQRQVDEHSRLLLVHRPERFARLMRRALQIGFFEMELELPNSTQLRHTAVSHPEYGNHRVIWAEGSSPLPPEEFVSFDKEIRAFLAGSFTEEFGC